MAEVIAFSQRKASARKRSPAGAVEAVILFFTGIRYERREKAAGAVGRALPPPAKTQPEHSVKHPAKSPAESNGGEPVSS